MKTLVVGDLHGQFEIVNKVLRHGLPTVFVGDYLDSYTLGVEEQIHTLDLVLDAVEQGKAVGLLGNHELSYLYSYMRCSGWNFNTDSHIPSRRDKILKLLKPYVWAEGFLISHAGVSNLMLEIAQSSLEEYLAAEKFNDIGYYRGGRCPVGGLHWCDWRYEFAPVPGVKQIVGHTRGKDIREVDGNYCIDVLEDGAIKVLAIEDGTAEVWEL